MLEKVKVSNWVKMNIKCEPDEGLGREGENWAERVCHRKGYKNKHDRSVGRNTDIGIHHADVSDEKHVTTNLGEKLHFYAVIRNLTALCSCPDVL